MVPEEYFADLRSPLPPLVTTSDFRVASTVRDALVGGARWSAVLMVLWLAGINQRSLEGIRCRWRSQAGLVLSIAFVAAAVGAVRPLLWWYLATH